MLEITSSLIFLRQTTGWKEPIMIREKGFLVLYMGRKNFHDEEGLMN